MFYTYRQNNSGGSFHVDRDVNVYVIVECDSFEDANRRAEDIGVYFDGCSKSLDCKCCGDRWSRAEADWCELDPYPAMYGGAIELVEVERKRANAVLYFVNGSRKYLRV